MSIWKLLYFWACYWFPFLPACPAIGRREDADCIFLQALGRNSLPDHEAGKVLWDIRTEARSDDLKTFHRLAELDFRPGRMNEALGHHCAEIVEGQDVHLFGQWEPMHDIWRQHPEWYEKHRHLLHVIWPPRSGYLTTPDVKRICIREMRKLKLSRPMEVAHPAMKTRAVAIIWAMGVRPIVEAVSPFSFWHHELWLWDTNSVQEWVRRFLPSPADRYAKPHAVAGGQHMGWINILNQLFPCFAKYEFAARVQHVLYGFTSLLPHPPAVP